MTRLLRAALCLSLLPGCSFIWLKEHEDVGPGYCTTNPTHPIGDTIIAAGAAGMGTLLVVADDGDFVTAPPGYLFLAVAASFAASAVYGYLTVAECRRHVLPEL